MSTRIHSIDHLGPACCSSQAAALSRAGRSSSSGMGEHGAQGSGDHAMVGFGNPLQQVSGEVDTTVLPDAALQLPADRLGEPLVGVGDQQLDPSKAALFERGKEFTPEALAFGVVHLEAQQLGAAVGIDAHGEDDGPLSDVNQVDGRGEVDAACGSFFVSPTSLPWLERWCC